jgi:hypothetical protein
MVGEVEFQTKPIRQTSGRTVALCSVVVGLVYFADLFLRASRKCFWYDELFTLYLCQLPDFKHTWAAVAMGADYNPPLLYLFTRGAHRIFGEGLITTRLPEMIAVWIFCVCLFFFVSRRAGDIAGFVAGIFPFFTTVKYYAYEARPHGITLGWCGLALICWQRSHEERTKAFWLTGLGLSFAGALLTHVYAVYMVLAFAAAEIYLLIRNRRANWGIILAIALPFAGVLPLYLSLTRTYRATIPTTFAPASSHEILRPVFTDKLALSFLIFLFCLALFTLVKRRKPGLLFDVPQREIVLAICLTCIPLLGLAGAKLSHGPFIPRYFLSGVAGFAIIFGFASPRVSPRPWRASLLAGLMFLLMLGDLGQAIYLWMRPNHGLIGPSSGLHFGRSPQNPPDPNTALLGLTNDEDIMILQAIDYLYLYTYSPPTVARHLVFATPSTSDLFLGEYQRLAALAQVDVKATTVAAFLATHKKFFVYGRTSECAAWQHEFLSAGYKLTSARTDMDNALYEYQK